MVRGTGLRRNAVLGHLSSVGVNRLPRAGESTINGESMSNERGAVVNHGLVRCNCGRDAMDGCMVCKEGWKGPAREGAAASPVCA